MRNIHTRLEKVERRMGVGVNSEPVCRIMMTALNQPLLPAERCMEILTDAGYWPRKERAFSMVVLLNVPRGLNERQTEMFLREHGEVVFSGAGPDAPNRAREDFMAKYGLVLNEGDGFYRSR